MTYSSGLLYRFIFQVIIIEQAIFQHLIAITHHQTIENRNREREQEGKSLVITIKSLEITVKRSHRFFCLSTFQVHIFPGTWCFFYQLNAMHSVDIAVDYAD